MNKFFYKRNTSNNTCKVGELTTVRKTKKQIIGENKNGQKFYFDKKTEQEIGSPNNTSLKIIPLDEFEDLKNKDTIETKIFR